MLEALEYYQSLAQRFPSRLLVGPGIAIFLIGLCVWLSGLRWKMIIGALTGAAIAAAGVFIIGKFSSNIVAAAAIIGLGAGAVINRIAIGIFGSLALALIVMLAIANGFAAARENKPMVEVKEYSREKNEIVVTDYTAAEYPTFAEYEIESMPIETLTALEITIKSAGFYASKAKAAIGSTGIIGFACGAVAAVIAVIVALAAPRIFIAVVSSMLGTAIIFLGMIILLFYKNSKPINQIAGEPYFYTVVFAAMIVFGMVVQLALSPSVKKVEQTDEGKN